MSPRRSRIKAKRLRVKQVIRLLTGETRERKSKRLRRARSWRTPYGYFTNQAGSYWINDTIAGIFKEHWSELVNLDLTEVAPGISANGIQHICEPDVPAPTVTATGVQERISAWLNDFPDESGETECAPDEGSGL